MVTSNTIYLCNLPENHIYKCVRTDHEVCAQCLRLLSFEYDCYLQVDTRFTLCKYCVFDVQNKVG